MDHPKTEAAIAMERLFPADATAHTSRIFDVPRRNVERMYDGRTNCPRSIMEKLTHQAELKAELTAGITALLRDAEAAGLHPLVARFELFETIHSGRFDGEHRPL